MKKNFVSIIPARKNSSTIINKNRIKIKNFPLIEYTFKEVAKSKKLHENYLLTDCNKIKKISKKYKINSEYIRPASTSRDNSSLVETLIHFLKKTKKKFNYLVVLQPTSPLRKSIDIDKAIIEFKRKNYTSLCSISESLEHPYETIDLKKNKWEYNLIKANKFFRRQDFDINSYFINGAIYIVSRKYLEKKKKIISNNHGFYIMPKSRSIDLNDMEEMKIIKGLI